MQFDDLPQVFLKHFASKKQLPGLSINGTLAKNGLLIHEDNSEKIQSLVKLFQKLFWKVSETLLEKLYNKIGFGTCVFLWIFQIFLELIFFLTSSGKCFSKYHRIHNMFLTVLARELQICKDVLYSKYVFSFQLKVFPIIEQWSSYGETMMTATVWWLCCDGDLIMMVPWCTKNIGRKVPFLVKFQVIGGQLYLKKHISRIFSWSFWVTTCTLVSP